MSLSVGSRVWLLAFLGLGIGSSGHSDCDPLVPENCLLPIPNDFYTATAQDNWDNGNDIRIDFGPTTLPKLNFNDLPVDPTDWNEQLDGWPTMGAAITYIPGLEDTSFGNQKTATHGSIGDSLLASSPTVLYNTLTGDIVPHWCELDASSGDTYNETAKDRRAFMMWSALPLNFSTEYYIGIRGYSNTLGVPLKESVSPAFKSLRDDTPSSDPDVNSRRDKFNNIFSSLSEFGWKRENVITAWSFTTVSRARTLGPFNNMYTDALARLGPEGPDFTITKVEAGGTNRTSVVLRGTFTGPCYMHTNCKPGSELNYDDAGIRTSTPKFTSMVEVPFIVSVPASFVTSQKPGRILQYGHGLFGNQDEVVQDYLQAMADDFGYVLAGIDWWGLSKPDVPSIAVMMATNTKKFRIVPDRSHQGILNQALLTELIQGKLSSYWTKLNKTVPFDPATAAYYGNSCGGILGAAFMGITRKIKHGVLGVAGASMSLLLPRSKDFLAFIIMDTANYKDPLDRISLLSVFQMPWDRAAPGGLVRNFTAAEGKKVLIQFGIGDEEVTYFGAMHLGRALGTSVFPNTSKIGTEDSFFGMSTLQNGSLATGNVIVGFDFGAPNPPSKNVPANNNFGIHEAVRRNALAIKQLHIFFENGFVEDVCNGHGCHVKN
eukprot:m.16393 g.16393  ORF g.16393 m.16393 type:complete len:659 (+) comp11018_c0_seq2:279-2255(+)